ncbi:MAG: FtsX-like permease family protein [Candidatus Marinimicrobia bacterium]|jgi:putative ABC transport system permease protein|nr:FtsX-like permease family protein [Candidatus Neomarinimicrobiota bacterium]MBT3634692.1 FtsX-like permease family protein [Candidatus Neomarinimicrobiota bacterium]MBT3683467.1 FtsX-like permease family protein [Candidatus Neomarinimicrobiota bacterium]MBT3760344.1 FtsX-like permease family protein [Candidatus Neomarinimicrobiota bacterium]MBT3896578.1 FtsX-like permease family protein [Candidatus Neomarinimicrobiota bacterium]
MLINYLKIAIKVLLRHKLFTFISLFGISLTLLILIMVTSLLDHTFGSQPPELKLDRTLSITMGLLTSKDGGQSNGPVMSPYFLKKYVKSLKTPEVVSMSSFHNRVITYKNRTKFRLDIKYTDSEFFEILDFNFLEGNPYSLNDVSSRRNVIVINQNTREQYFDGEEAIGNTMEVEGEKFRVIGVVENCSILRIMPYADVWLPLTFSKTPLDEVTLIGGFPGWFAMMLATDESDIPAIKKEFQNQLALVEYPDDKWVEIKTAASTYAEAFSRNLRLSEEGNAKPLLIILFILMILFMLLPTINLVNINLSRIMERSSEIGVRKAFGASSLTLVGQFVVENVIITLIGGAIALILAIGILEIINSSSLIPYVNFSLNYRIFFNSLVICLFFGLFSGVYPAFKMSRLQPVDALRGESS